jgi:hypothetical protein
MTMERGSPCKLVAAAAAAAPAMGGLGMGGEASHGGGIGREEWCVLFSLGIGRFPLPFFWSWLLEGMREVEGKEGYRVRLGERKRERERERVDYGPRGGEKQGRSEFTGESP